ncbi:MAG TPA: hypothetical protein VGM56_19730 [Byssovorax sp.]
MPEPRPAAPSTSTWTLTRASRLALAIYAGVTVAMLVTAGAARLSTHTPYDHFALLAEAWLHGRLDLGGPPPAYAHHNDFAELGGKTFVSFPPFPALLIAPLVALCGSAERTPDALFFGLFTGVGPAFLFLALERLREARRVATSERENVGLALLFAFGTVYWFSAVQGTVWFAAHVVGVALACVYAWAAIDARRPVVAGVALALGFATRTPLGFAFPLFAFEALRVSDVDLGCLPDRGDRRRGGDLRRAARLFAVFAAPGFVVTALLLWHNAARFGDPFEFGHKLLAVAWRARMQRWGLFSFHYLGRNLAVALAGMPYFGGGAPLQINGHGLALWITSPFYAWAIWPRRTGALFWALALTAAAVALPSLLYQNSGWLQFGYRFSNDYAPFLVLLVAVGRRRLGDAFWALGAVAVAVNLFGAVTFGREGYERYYFVDPTQKVLVQPD